MKRRLRANKYDALELAAWSVDGVGAGRYHDPNTGACLCINAIAWLAGITETVNTDDGDIANAINNADSLKGQPFGNERVADAIVHAINKRKGLPSNSRVTFVEFAAEAGFERGDA